MPGALNDRLWVDDKRPPPEEDRAPTGGSLWPWAKSVPEALACLKSWSQFAIISLDYSLGGPISDPNSSVVPILEWLRDHPEKWPTRELRAHSGSSGGRSLVEVMAKEFAPPGWTGKIIDTGGF